MMYGLSLKISLSIKMFRIGILLVDIFDLFGCNFVPVVYSRLPHCKC